MIRSVSCSLTLSLIDTSAKRRVATKGAVHCSPNFSRASSADPVARTAVLAVCGFFPWHGCWVDGSNSRSWIRGHSHSQVAHTCICLACVRPGMWEVKRRLTHIDIPQEYIANLAYRIHCTGRNVCATRGQKNSDRPILVFMPRTKIVLQ